MEDSLDRPVATLNNRTFVQLSCKLSCDQDVGVLTRDWRGVAAVLGFTVLQIEQLEKHREFNKGKLLIMTWDRLGGSSVRKMVYALLELKMEDCLSDIKDDPGVNEEDYEKAKAEYEKIKSDNRLHEIFPELDIVDVYNALEERPLWNGREVYPNQYPEFRQEQCLLERSMERLVLNEKPVLERNNIFISYCPVSGTSAPKFDLLLSRFVDMLRVQGYVVHYEPYCSHEIRQYGGVARWKEVCIKKSPDIIVVCTPEYYHEDEKSLHRTQSKIEVDCRLLRQLAYNNEQNTRLIPVLFDCYKVSKKFMPMWVASAPAYKWPSKEDDLLYCLARVPKYHIPVPAKKKTIKPKVIKPRKHNPFKK